MPGTGTKGSRPDSGCDGFPEGDSVDELLIRRVVMSDFEAIYLLGRAAPELQVSATEPFMHEEEFRSAMGNPAGLMLVALVTGRPVGFLYAAWKDPEAPPCAKVACMVYVVISPQHRRHGIARQMHDECIRLLRERGIRWVYGWARTGGDVLHLMRSLGYAEGHQYTWVEREL
jgi:GNAT superfamily N-acetyltransferase